MKINLKNPLLMRKGGKNLLICLIFSGILLGFVPVFESKGQEIELVLNPVNLDGLATIEGNSLLPIARQTISCLDLEHAPVQKIHVLVTGYSSTPWETDDTPWITAAGTGVRDGIIANNLLPFGTKVKIPELYGDKVFVVEDRMHWEKSNYHIDIWFPNYEQALNFGVKRTYAEILNN